MHVEINHPSLAPFQELEKVVQKFNPQKDLEKVSNLFKECLRVFKSSNSQLSFAQKLTNFSSLSYSILQLKKKLWIYPSTQNKFFPLTQDIEGTQCWQDDLLSQVTELFKNATACSLTMDQLENILSPVMPYLTLQIPLLQKLRFVYSQAVEAKFLDSSSARLDLIDRLSFKKFSDPNGLLQSPFDSLVQNEIANIATIQKLFVGTVSQKEAEGYLMTKEEASCILRSESGRTPWIVSMKQGKLFSHFPCANVAAIVSLLEQKKAIVCSPEEVIVDVTKKIADFTGWKRKVSDLCQVVKEGEWKENEIPLAHLIKLVSGRPLGLLSTLPTFKMACNIIVEAVWNNIIEVEACENALFASCEEPTKWPCHYERFKKEKKGLENRLKNVSDIPLPLQLENHLKEKLPLFDAIAKANASNSLRPVLSAIEACNIARANIFANFVTTPRDKIDALFDNFFTPYQEVTDGISNREILGIVQKKLSSEIDSLQTFQLFLSKFSRIMAFAKSLQNETVATAVLSQLKQTKWLLFFSEEGEWQRLEKTPEGTLELGRLIEGEKTPQNSSCAFSQLIDFVENNYESTKKIENRLPHPLHTVHKKQLKPSGSLGTFFCKH